MAHDGNTAESLCRHKDQLSSSTSNNNDNNAITNPLRTCILSEEGQVDKDFSTHLSTHVSTHLSNLSDDNHYHDRAQYSHTCWETESWCPMTSRPHYMPRQSSQQLQQQQQPADHEQVTATGEEESSSAMLRHTTRSVSLGCATDLLLSIRQKEQPQQQEQHEQPVMSSAYCIAVPGSLQQEQQAATGRTVQDEEVGLQQPDPEIRRQRFDFYDPTNVHNNDDNNNRNGPDLMARRDSNEDHDDKTNLATVTSGTALVGEEEQEGDLPGVAAGVDDDVVVEVSGNPKWISILYGLINATIVLPVLMSFASIIYRDQAFAPYMSILVKLTTVSGIVHQFYFSTLSSLPFAVGQVQDAGT